MRFSLFLLQCNIFRSITSPFFIMIVCFMLNGNTYEMHVITIQHHTLVNIQDGRFHLFETKLLLLFCVSAFVFVLLFCYFRYRKRILQEQLIKQIIQTNHFDIFVFFFKYYNEMYYIYMLGYELKTTYTFIKIRF